MTQIRQRLVREESGWVIVSVIILFVIGLAVVFAALAAALTSNNQALRDGRVRRAQAAADAGVQTQLYQQSEADLGSSSYNLNGGLLGTGLGIDCVVPNVNASLQVTGLTTTYVSGTNACPQAQKPGPPPTVTTYTTGLGDQTSDQSEFFPNDVRVGGVSSENEMFPVIVSLGSEATPVPVRSGMVYDREKVLLAPVAPLQAVEGMGNVTINGLSAAGINILATVNGDISSLGTLSLPVLTVGVNLLSSSIFPTFSAESFCTNGLLGGCPGVHIATAYYNTVSSTACQAGTPSATCVIKRQPVSVTASKPDCSVTCPTVSGVPNGSTDGDNQSVGSASYDTLTMTHASESITFQPGDYVFCNWNVTAGSVTANASAGNPVRIFIDSPSSSRCSGDTSGGGNFIDSTNAGIDNVLEPTNPTSVTGNVAAPSGLQIYVTGNGTGNGTTVQIGPSTESTSLSAIYSGIIYAPQSNVKVNVPAACLVTVCTGGVFDGSVIGDTVSLSALTITEDLDIGNYPLYTGVNAFRPVQYIDCGSSAASQSLTGNQSTDTGGC